MKNGYKIYWSAEAKENLISLIKYLEQNWSEKETSYFIKKLDKRIKLISAYPEIFPVSIKKKFVRRSILSKQITVYYSINIDRIDILSLFDVRQNPIKLKL